MARKAIFRTPWHKLATAIGLPDGCHILSPADESLRPADDECYLLITHPALPDTPEGHKYPEVRPVYYSPGKNKPLIFEGWRIVNNG